MLPVDIQLQGDLDQIVGAREVRLNGPHVPRQQDGSDDVGVWRVRRAIDGRRR